VAAARFLLSHGFRSMVNEQNDRGDTPAMVAAYFKNFGVLRVLVAAGADVIQKGSSPMPVAWESCQKNQEGLDALHSGSKHEMNE
jgi:hypothetical protein